MTELHNEINLQLDNYRRVMKGEADTVVLNLYDYLELENDYKSTVNYYPTKNMTCNGCKIIKSKDIPKGNVKVFYDLNNV